MSLSIHLSEWKSKASKEEQHLRSATFEIFEFAVKISQSDERCVCEHASPPAYLRAQDTLQHKGR